MAHRTAVGHDVWIGHGATIMPGVTVGNGAIVGAGAVVANDVDPYMVVGGAPARFIKRRFPEQIATALEKIAWWEWSREQLDERLADFTDLDRFLETYA